MAKYKNDALLASVFLRADTNMYENKKMLKGETNEVLVYAEHYNYEGGKAGNWIFCYAPYVDVQSCTV